MGRICQKRLVGLFIDKNKQTDVKTLSPNGLLLWTPISIVMTLLPRFCLQSSIQLDLSESIDS
jgi:hypothetical protein